MDPEDVRIGMVFRVSGETLEVCDMCFLIAHAVVRPPDTLTGYKLMPTAELVKHERTDNWIMVDKRKGGVVKAEEVKVGMVFQDNEVRRPSLKEVVRVVPRNLDGQPVAVVKNVRTDGAKNHESRVLCRRLVKDYKFILTAKEGSNGQGQTAEAVAARAGA